MTKQCCYQLVGLMQAPKFIRHLHGNEPVLSRDHRTPGCLRLYYPGQLDFLGMLVMHCRISTPLIKAIAVTAA